MSLKQTLKKIYNNQVFLTRIFCFFYNSFNGNKYILRGRLNNVNIGFNSLMKHNRITIRGSNNKVVVSKGGRLTNCSVLILGDNNTIIINENCIMTDCHFWIEDNGNEIILGEGTTIHGKTQIACIEGRKVNIGKDCMFSSNITLRTGDSHSIVDKSGDRINDSMDITLGNHVWVCADSSILKGACIPDCSIIGTGSIVTKVFKEENTVIAGIPAKVIKQDINWLRERI